MSSRRVLVTGASRGIGAALVERLLDRGDRVFGCGRADTGPDLTHPAFTYLQADVSDEQAVRALFREIRKAAGGLDALINNAGIARMNLLALTPADDARRIVDTNLLGTFHCLQQAARLMHKTGGRIVNLTTVAVPLRLEGEAMYAASKAAVESLTRVAAREFGPLGITCNAIGPTPIRTDLIAGVPADKIEALVARQAIREWATVDDVYNVVDFFLRPESRQITGQVIYLGGLG